MSVPALRALRHIFSDSEITLHTRSGSDDIFLDSGLVDRFIVYDKPESTLKEVIARSRTLRSERFDLAVLFPNSLASAVTARFAGIPRRFGYSKEARGFFLTDPVKIPEWKSERHEAFYYLALIGEVERRLLGTDKTSSIAPSTNLTISDERRRHAREFLSERGLDLSRPLVAIGPGSTNSAAKRWPAERFAELTGRLHDAVGANVVLLGSSGDAAAGNVINSLSVRVSMDLIGKTTLGEAAAILSVCDLMVSNDMGLAHLAPAVGTRTIVLFGPTDPTTTRPFSDLGEVLRVGVECSPCMLRECPIDHRCMTRMTVQMVFDSAIKALEKNDKRIFTAPDYLSGP
jgi:heptosyltransferase-2